MTIRPIMPAILVNKANQLNFEGKKEKQGDTHIENTISHKIAVPLAATILAMSAPYNSARADMYDDFSEDQTELVEEKPDKKSIFESENGNLLAAYNVPTKIRPNAMTHRILFIDTDNNPETVEKIIWRASNGVVIYETDIMNGFVVTENTRTDGTVYNSYKAASKRMVYRKNSEGIYEKEYMTGPQTFYKQGFIDYLMKLTDNKLPLTVVKRTEDKEKGFSVDDIYNMLMY